VVAGQSAFEPEPWHRTALLGGVAAAVLGLAALLLGTGVLLAAFVIAVLLTWAPPEG
jgi:hypothetical protein